MIYSVVDDKKLLAAFFSILVSGCHFKIPSFAFVLFSFVNAGWAITQLSNGRGPAALLLVPSELSLCAHYRPTSEA